MKLFKCLLLLMSLGAMYTVSAQKKLITGKVTDAQTGTPMNGVSIVTENKKVGTSTQADGSFSLTIDNSSSTLVFTYVGYAPKFVVVEGNTTLNVSMTVAAATADNEVIVVGYGTQKKSTVTGAVSKYKNENLEETPSSRLDQALQGKIAGVQIQNVSSEAGADPRVTIRGSSSISAASSPLVVVDGHPVPDGLAFVNMADVESVEVLKDAASAAIYGSRAAGGVILITTKSGSSGKTKYSLKYSSGVKQAYKLYDMMTTTDYTKMLFEEAALKLQDPSITPPTLSQIASTPERAAYIIENDLRGGESTNWQREAIRQAATTNVQLNVSGGSKDLKYYISGGYQNDQGMMYHSEYEKFNIRSKIDAQLGKKLKLSINLNPSYIKRERPSTGYIDFVRFPSYLPVRLNETLAAYVRQDPAYADVKAGDFAQARYFNGRVYSGLMPDGSNWVNTSAITPFSTANNTPKSVLETRTITTNDYRALTSADLTYNVMPGLDLKTTASAYVNYQTGLDFANTSSNRAGDVNRGVFTNRLFVDLLSENTVNYTKRIKNHSINFLAGFTVQKTKMDTAQTTGLGFPSDNIRTLNTALTIEQANTYTNKNAIGLVSYLSRFTYGYLDKYLLSASYRTDGSSYFAPGKKWGSFPSLSLGWVASKEDFLNDIDWLSNLKFRGSYGTTGNNRIVDFAFVDLLYAANYSFGAGNGAVTAGQLPSRAILANPDITWERTFQYNGGVDIGLFRNKVTISTDVYQSKTDQLLLQQSALGFAGVPLTWNNIGSIKNNGVELEISSTNINSRNLRWTTSANFSHVRNSVIELGSEKFILNQGERTELYMNKIGDPLIQFFGYKTDGVWLSQAQINEEQAKGLKSNLSNVFVPGGLKLVDINGDNVIDVNDRTVIGNPYADFTWGLTNNIKYKSFDASFLVQGVQGGQLINGDANYNESKRYNRSYSANRWISPMFPGDGKTPYSTNGFNWMLTDYVVEDASYYALREVLIGYTLPEKFVKKAKLNSLRLYASAQNLYFHSASGYRGIAPEARINSGNYATPLVNGYQRGSFPMPSTFLFGVDVNF